MENKKKSLNIFLYTLLAMFFGITLENSCNAVTLDDYQLTDEIMEDIVEEVGLSGFYSGDYIPLLTNNFNTMMRTVRARGDGHLVTLRDCVFAGTYSSNVSLTSLQVAFINWRDNDSTRAFYENNQQPYMNLYGQQQEGNTISGQTGVGNWTGWTYDSNNNITGYTSGYLHHWRINQTSATFINNANLYIDKPTFTRIRSGDIAINKMIVLDNSSIDDDGYVMFAARTYQWGFGFYIYSHVLYLDDYGVIPTPTPTPIPTPTGGGGSGSTDLTNTNNLIGEVVSSLNDTPSGDDFTFPSSGDLTSALGISDFGDFPEVSATDNFWLSITDGLYSAFTSDVRYYDIDFLGINFTLDNQAFIITNQYINSFLSIVEVVTFVFVEYKIIRKLVNMFSSGVFSQIMRAYGKIDISDLF